MTIQWSEWLAAMTLDRETLKVTLAVAFQSAKAKDPLEYVNTLVRVDGIKEPPDPFDSLHEVLWNSSPPADGMRQQYRRLLDDEEVLRFLWNLFGCMGGDPYHVNPFVRGEYPQQRRLPMPAFRAELLDRARRFGTEELASIVAAVFDEGATAPEAASEQVAASLERIRAFLSTLLEAYRAERLRWRSEPRYVKLPGFEVLELLTNDALGLYGFRIHFSNGNRAEFRRDDGGVMAVNLMFGPPVTFNVGAFDDLRPEWRIGNKRLYEVGLPGRYNQLGEWKPIFYPGDFSRLEKEAAEATTDDDVRGALFYMLATGHRAIEFVVKANIDLPVEYINLPSTSEPPDVLHLWKCPVEEDAVIGMNYRLYDGWVEVGSTDTGAFAPRSP